MGENWAMKYPRCLLLAVLLAWVATVADGGTAEMKSPDLIGVVKGKDGKPISEASAFIYTAGPRLGVGFL